MDASDQTLYEMMQKAAVLHSTRIAVTFDSCTEMGTTSRTYKELLLLANELTDLLKKDDRQSGQIFGLYCYPGINIANWILGILQLPAAYAPLDPDSPPYLCVRFMELCGLRRVMVQTDLFQRFHRTFSPHLLVEVCQEWHSQGITLVKVLQNFGSSLKYEEQSVGSSLKYEEQNVGSSLNSTEQGVGSSLKYEEQSVGSSLKSGEQSVGSSLKSGQQSVGSSLKYEEQNVGSSLNSTEQGVGSSLKYEEQNVGSSLNSTEQGVGSSLKYEEQSVGSSLKSGEQSVGSSLKSGQQSVGSSLKYEEQNVGSSLKSAEQGIGSCPRCGGDLHIQHGTACWQNSDSQGLLAYVLHTSGTTGLPKIVRVPHRCIMPNILQLRSLFQVTAEDVVFMASPLTFDPSVVEMFLSLSSGARLLIVPTVIKKVPDRLATVLFKHHRITILQATPTLLGRFGGRVLQAVVLCAATSLRILALGGEACPPVSVLRSWRGPGNSTQFFNLYGTTEVSCWATCCQLHLDTMGEESVPLGEALMGTAVEVRDEDGRRLTQGTGQLFIGGQDRVCFLGDEVAIVPGTMRSTGDWVELRDSHLFYLGRRDRLVKRHGQRLHLDALHQVLQSLPQVDVCAVALWEGQRLVAFVVPAPSQEDPTPSNRNPAPSQEDPAPSNENPAPSHGDSAPSNEKPAPSHGDSAPSCEDPAASSGGPTPTPGGPSSGELQREIFHRLRQLLPSYSIPECIMLFPALPLTSHGKVDMSALLHVYEKQRPVLMSHDVPVERDTLRDHLQKLWRDALSLSDDASVAMDSRFLLSGGDSLRSVRLCDDITAAVGVAVAGLLEIVLSGSFSDLLDHVATATLERVGEGDAAGPPAVFSQAKRRRPNPLPTAPAKRKPLPPPAPPRGRFTVVQRAAHILSFHGNTASHTAGPNEGTDQAPSHTVPNDGTDHAPSHTAGPNEGSDHAPSHTAGPIEGTDQAPSHTVPNDGTDHAPSHTAGPNEGSDHASSHTAGPIEGTDHAPSHTAGPNKGTDHAPSHSARPNEGTDHAPSHSAGPNEGTDHAPSHSAGPNEGTDHAPSHSAGPSGGAAGGSVLDLCVRWRSDTGRCVDASPVLLVSEWGGAVAYVGSHSHRLQAIALTGGRLLWERVLGGRLEAAAAVTPSGSLIAIGCYDGQVYFLGAESGQTHWEFRTGAAVKSCPAVDPLTGLVLVGSHDGHMYALDPEAQSCGWSRQCGGGAIFSSPCLHPSLRHLYVATLRGELLCLRPETGALMWTHSSTAPFFSSPCCSGATLCIGSVDRNVYGFSHSGTLLWRPCANGSPCANGKLFCGSHDGSVYCLRSCDGAVLWRFRAGGKVYSSPFLFPSPACEDEGLVAIATTDGMLWILGAEDGEPRASLCLPGEIFSSPVLWGRTLVVGCRNDFVYGVELTFAH